MTDLSGKKKNYSLSYIRVIACFAVVILHTANASEILFKDSITIRQIACSMGTVYGMMFAVPCFLMVTGALLLDPKKEISNTRLIGHYVPKALEPLIVLGFFFEIFDDVADGKGITINTLKNAVVDIFTGRSWSHLWYLYMLLGIYLLLPFYRIIAINSSNFLFKYLLAMYVIFQSVLQLTKIWGINCAFILQVSGIYVFYLFAGYAISKDILKIPRWLSVLLFLVGIAGTASLTAYRYASDFERLEVVLGSYASPFVIMAAVGFFAFIYRDKSKEPQKSKGREAVLEFFDDNSFGVYLLHMVFVRIILRYQHVNPYEYGMPFFIILVLGIFLISTMVTYLVRIPVKKFRRLMRDIYWRKAECDQKRLKAE
ncbi:acyltransferase [Butyrivibrio sp. VCB2006]|uniref:acyltransferase n=1 Tax=Butyrivibrio sp. VCB2006 TaxID=1280679 RepID=UPI00049296A7|nr:acyltransferase [Butyrivibrio sp. VCB2006]